MEQLFQSLKQDYAGQIQFVDINVNNPAEQDIVYRYKVQYIPTTCLVNHKGEVDFYQVGFVPREELINRFTALVEASKEE